MNPMQSQGPYLGCANFGPMKALGTSQLVPTRSPGNSCSQSNSCNGSKFVFFKMCSFSILPEKKESCSVLCADGVNTLVTALMYCMALSGVINDIKHIQKGAREKVTHHPTDQVTDQLTHPSSLQHANVILEWPVINYSFSRFHYKMYIVHYTFCITQFPLPNLHCPFSIIQFPLSNFR